MGECGAGVDDVASKVGAGTPQMAGSAARLCHAGVANPTQPPTTCENFNR